MVATLRGELGGDENRSGTSHLYQVSVTTTRRRYKSVREAALVYISNIENFFSVTLVVFIPRKVEKKVKSGNYRSYVSNLSKFRSRTCQGRCGKPDLTHTRTVAES